MILDTDTFELWMSKIMERFDRHEQVLSKLAGKEIKEVKYLDGERLLGQSGLGASSLQGEQTLAASLPQLRHAALPDAVA